MTVWQEETYDRNEGCVKLSYWDHHEPSPWFARRCSYPTLLRYKSILRSYDYLTKPLLYSITLTQRFNKCFSPLIETETLPILRHTQIGSINPYTSTPPVKWSYHLWQLTRLLCKIIRAKDQKKIIPLQRGEEAYHIGDSVFLSMANLCLDNQSQRPSKNFKRNMSALTPLNKPYPS